jgi:3'-5' exoribonuclease
VPRSIEQAQRYLEASIKQRLLEPYRRLCEFAVKNYSQGYGGSKHHHAYLGGLSVHVAEVMEHALTMAGPSIDLEVLITAVVWHDYDKLREYLLQEDSTIGHTSYAKTIGHVAGSALAFSFHASSLPPEKKEAILHCLLSHHGRREWGSPIEPTTLEAWILHSADMLSSRGQ